MQNRERSDRVALDKLIRADHDSKMVESRTARGGERMLRSISFEGISGKLPVNLQLSASVRSLPRAVLHLWTGIPTDHGCTLSVFYATRSLRSRFCICRPTMNVNA